MIFPLLALLFTPNSYGEGPVKDMQTAVDVAYTELQTKADGGLGREPNQLSMTRSQTFGNVDSCPFTRNQKTFGDAIEGSIRLHFKPYKANFIELVRKIYFLPSLEESTEVSLISHPFCEVNKDSITHMLGEGFAPGDDAIENLKNITQSINKARTEYFAERENAQRERRNENPEKAQRLSDLYFGIMGCISYEESLASPGDLDDEKTEMDKDFADYLTGSPVAKEAFLKVNKSLTRPKGVIAYTDRPGGYVIDVRALNEEARKQKIAGTYNEADYQKKLKAIKDRYDIWTVLGLYQFSPDGYGNIRPCIERWDEVVPKPACAVDKGSGAQVPLALLSPAQTFNAFCGVEKIVHSFFSQVNTSSADGTDLSNLKGGKIAKLPKDRCVSLVSRGGNGKVYSHFGPLRNSVKDNLGHVLQCAARALTLDGININP